MSGGAGAPRLPGDGPVVVLDLGGVVLRICRTWADGCRAAGMAVAEGLDEARLARESAPLMRDYQSGLVAYAEFTARLAAMLGGSATADDVARVHERWILEAYPGVDALLGELADAGVPVVALSNTCAVHAATFDDYAPMRRLAHRFLSHELGAVKPDPAPFEAVERGTGRTGDRLLYFDDTAPNVAVARARGWRAHEVDPAGDTAGQLRAALVEAGLLAG